MRIRCWGSILRDLVPAYMNNTPCFGATMTGRNRLKITPRFRGKQLAASWRIRVNHRIGKSDRSSSMDRAGSFSAERPWTQIMGRIFPGGLLLRDGTDTEEITRNKNGD